jgi:hypothetical protein
LHALELFLEIIQYRKQTKQTIMKIWDLEKYQQEMKLMPYQLINYINEDIS